MGTYNLCVNREIAFSLDGKSRTLKFVEKYFAEQIPLASLNETVQKKVEKLYLKTGGLIENSIRRNICFYQIRQ
ncbi:hypothetical protein J9303_10685 [Bacillaceae bacterium Marseille-Q3522]|nr:hypothetical protein [Bacillaceae bacterium Marseille-Q3522]